MFIAYNLFVQQYFSSSNKDSIFTYKTYNIWCSLLIISLSSDTAVFGINYINEGAT